MFLTMVHGHCLGKSLTGGQAVLPPARCHAHNIKS